MGGFGSIFNRWFSEKGAPTPESDPAASADVTEDPPGPEADAPSASLEVPSPPSPDPAEPQPVPEERETDAPAPPSDEGQTVAPDPSETPDSRGETSLRTVPSTSVDEFVESFFEDLGGRSPREEFPAPDVSPEPTVHEPLLADPPEENRELFEGIAASYVRPVRQFLFRLREGPVSAEWLDICLPALGMVSNSARQMGLESVAQALRQFEEPLHRARAGGQTLVTSAQRDTILTAYEALVGILPEAFGLQEDEDQRDSVIVHSLLRRVPGIGRVSLDKVFAAGLTTIEMLERANSLDLSATTGVSAGLAERMCDAVEAYVAEREIRAGLSTPREWLRFLAPPLERLERHHNGYGGAAGLGGDAIEIDASSTRREHRKGREDALLELYVLLAEMGEVRLVDDLQKIPFQSRIRRLRAFSQSLGNTGADPSEGSDPR